ncbi:chain length determinant protein tyrosine kinase EpsG [Massilia forsythiae]|uniref:Chain length determinant protein tyrosine kinase EpsG n=1 Tax=Massilia forsythiae TaxID=2728020 RepID=A0A7Z2VT45_9BURK|nr:chain length determinant protein tyrosine kinase EpsG [Massilia forsythiae]QJD98786.1 chain length determinant protein tyrosine kinase EpsG [Massilia forsythiae]
MNSPILNAVAADQVAEHAAETNPASSMGALLLEAGKLRPEDVERVLRLQKESGIRFGEAAVRLGLVGEEDIRQMLARQFSYPYLRKGQGGLSPRLAAAYEPFSPQVEALRAIRSQLMLRWFARGRRALAVVGIDPEDGAALFAANLAIVFAQLGEQTLLVDANLRAPRQQEAFALKPCQGLSDLLAGRAGLDVVARVPAFAELSVMPAGTLPPNPQELLARDAFRGLHAQLESRYDVVLYDVPPFESGVDAIAVAGRAGGALLVTRKHHTRIAHVGRAAEQLADAGCDILGSVVMEF